VHIDRLRLSALFAGLGALALSPAPAAAQDALPAEVSVHAGTVEIPLNKSQVVTANVAIERAMIGNPEIADILPVSDRSVYVLGKKIGTTSLTLYDRANRVIAVMDIAVGPDVISLREQMRQLMPGQPLFAQMSNDSIVLVGTATDAGTADRAVQLARAFAGADKVVNLMTLEGSQQVMLEVRFAEVSRDIGKDLRASAFFRSNGGAFSGAIGNGAQLTPDPETGVGVLGLEAITGSFGIFRRIFSDVAGLGIDAVLDTLEDRGMAKTLAEPTLIALSGQRASFLAGGEFPIPVVQNGAGGGAGGTSSITVEFKPFGVSLGFTPTVLAGGVINLLVEPEVSSIDPTASITLNGLTIPGLQTRRASTVLELRDGESFAIAGLLQRDFQTTIRQVPVLGQIPIIGTLFRSSSFQKGETELLIVVTPRLVAPIRPDQVQLPTDRVADPVQAEVLLNSREYVPVDLPPISGESQPSASTAPVAEDPNYDF
jgi:pilus assembly protein CpaC